MQLAYSISSTYIAFNCLSDHLVLTNMTNIQQITPPPLSKQQGFNIIEVLVALGIFAFAMIALGRLMVSTVEANRDARRITAATNLAMDKVESMRGVGSSSMAGYLGLANGTDGPFNEEGATSGTGLFYSRAWRVAANTPEVGSTTIQVRVRWDKDTTTGGVRDKRDVIYTTIIAAPNL